MTVAELIIALQSMPQDARVIIVGNADHSIKWDREVRDVIYNSASMNTDAHTVELDNWPKEGF